MTFYLIVGGVIAVLVIDLAMRFYYGRKAMELLDRMPPFRVDALPEQKQAIPFSTATADGLTLQGSIFYPEGSSPKALVVFCPETMANRYSAVAYCQGLLDAGYIVVSFDFRNQGASDSTPQYEPLHWVTEYEILDLQSILNWVREQSAFDDLPLGIFGVSRGASVALLTASSVREKLYLWVDSAYTNDLLIGHYVHRWVSLIVPRWVVRISPSMAHITATLRVAFWFQQFRKHCRYIHRADAIRKMKGNHVSMVAGERDVYVPASISREIQQMLGSQCEDLWIVPQAAHNGARGKSPAEYDARIVAFFNQMVPQPLSVPVEAVDIPVSLASPR